MMMELHPCRKHMSRTTYAARHQLAARQQDNGDCPASRHPVPSCAPIVASTSMRFADCAASKRAQLRAVPWTKNNLPTPAEKQALSHECHNVPQSVAERQRYTVLILQNWSSVITHDGSGLVIRVLHCGRSVSISQHVVGTAESNRGPKPIGACPLSWPWL